LRAAPNGPRAGSREPEIRAAPITGSATILRMRTFEAIVVGLGAHGSATAAELGRRGLSVLGLERFGRGAEMGSSGGRSRMMRLANYEDPALSPLASAAWDSWRDLEAETGSEILSITGGLYAGPADSRLVGGSIRSAEAHGVEHEILDADEIHRRWPVFELAQESVGVLDTRAGTLRADRAIEAQLRVAERHGAILEFERRVVDWRPAPGGGFEVETADGRIEGAAHLLLTAGSWLGSLVPDLGLPLQVERESVCWFEPTVDPVAIGADRMPMWIVAWEGQAYYGFRHDPDLGLKISIHHWGVHVDPETVDRVVGPADEERVRRFVRQYMPAADGPLVNTKVCLYTNTPDEAFVIDRHSAADGVAFASACSGQGFKYAPVVGRMLADLAVSGSTTWPIGPFRADRFGRLGPPG
jgi:sarcosine oxidase